MNTKWISESVLSLLYSPTHAQTAELLCASYQPRMIFFSLILSTLKTGVFNGSADTTLTRAV